MQQGRRFAHAALHTICHRHIVNQAPETEWQLMSSTASDEHIAPVQVPVLEVARLLGHCQRQCNLQSHWRASQSPDAAG